MLVVVWVLYMIATTHLPDNHHLRLLPGALAFPDLATCELFVETMAAEQLVCAERIERSRIVNGELSLIYETTFLAPLYQMGTFSDRETCEQARE